MLLPLRPRVDLGVMAMNGYTAFQKAPELQELHHQIVLCHIQDTHGRSLTCLKKCSRCILQSQLPLNLIQAKESLNNPSRFLKRFNFWYLNIRNMLTGKPCRIC